MEPRMQPNGSVTNLPAQESISRPGFLPRLMKEMTWKRCTVCGVKFFHVLASQKQGQLNLFTQIKSFADKRWIADGSIAAMIGHADGVTPIIPHTMLTPNGSLARLVNAEPLI